MNWLYSDSKLHPADVSLRAGGKGAGGLQAPSVGKSKCVEGEVSNWRRDGWGSTVITPDLPFVGRSLRAPEYMKVMVYLWRRKWEVLDGESGTPGNRGNNLLKTEHSTGTWEYWRWKPPLGILDTRPRAGRHPSYLTCAWEWLLITGVFRLTQTLGCLFLLFLGYISPHLGLIDFSLLVSISLNLWKSYSDLIPM